jgi:hypothetical protein
MAVRRADRLGVVLFAVTGLTLLSPLIPYRPLLDLCSAVVGHPPLCISSDLTLSPVHLPLETSDLTPLPCAYPSSTPRTLPLSFLLCLVVARFHQPSVLYPVYPFYIQ